MRILLSGSASFDRIMRFPGSYAESIQPEKLHVLSLSVLISELSVSRGGIAPNIAYTLSLLGEKPQLLVSVGEDAREYMADLAEHGIDTTAVSYSQLPTATYTVLTDSKDCQVGGFYLGAMAESAGLSLRPHVADQPFVVVSSHDPAGMRMQVAEAAELKLRLFYDVSQQVSNVDAADLLAGLAAAELLILNDFELGVFAKKTGKTEQEIIAAVETCVVTLGEQGSRVYANGQEYKIAAVPVSVVADPTGAGDAFRAGFLYGYVRDWDVAKCAQLGATTAAYAVEQRGTQNHSFTFEELAKRYKMTFNQDL